MFDNSDISIDWKLFDSVRCAKTYSRCKAYTADAIGGIHIARNLKSVTVDGKILDLQPHCNAYLKREGGNLDELKLGVRLADCFEDSFSASERTFWEVLNPTMFVTQKAEIIRRLKEINEFLPPHKGEAPLELVEDPHKLELIVKGPKRWTGWILWSSFLMEVLRGPTTSYDLYPKSYHAVRDLWKSGIEMPWDEVVEKLKDITVLNYDAIKWNLAEVERFSPFVIFSTAVTHSYGGFASLDAFLYGKTAFSANAVIDVVTVRILRTLGNY